MREDVDVRALFAELEKRGIEYAGDEDWHIAREADRLRGARERAELAAEEPEAVSLPCRELEAQTQQLLEAYERGDADAFDQAFWGAPAGNTPSREEADMLVNGTAMAVPEWLVVPDEEGSSLDGSEQQRVGEALSAPIKKPRWTYDGLQAHHYVRERRLAMLDARLRTFSLEWEESSRSGALENNFPSFVKSLADSEEIEAHALNEEREVFLPKSPGRFAVLPTEWTKQPAWAKLPGAAERPSELQELVFGARLASVARDRPGLFSWFHDVAGDDVCCFALELSEVAAQRFVAGDNGSVGNALHRGFRRRLERLLGPVAFAAMWVRPIATPGSVTVFMMIRRERTTTGWATEELRRSRRFHESLERHGVDLPPDSPLEVIGPHLSKYLGMSEEELRSPEIAMTWEEDLESRSPADNPKVARVVDYTPEFGLATDEELTEHANRSDEWWAKHTRRFGAPLWFDHRFVGLLHDYFLLSPEHVRERQKVKDALKHRQRTTTSAERKRLRSRLSRLLSAEAGIKIAISYFCTPPACFAALATRSGEILGEYCDSRHKAGRAKELYEELRRRAALCP